MSWKPWALLAAAAVIVFWMVGAYNRLMALRNRIGAAWSEVERARLRRADAAEPLLAALRAPLAAEQGALDSFGIAHALAVQAAERVSAMPVSAAATSAWARAESTLASAAARLLALAQQHEAWRGDPTLAALATPWHDAHKQIAAARTLFDHAAADYNAALAQAPTRWLRRLFGFEPAGLLGA